MKEIKNYDNYIYDDENDLVINKKNNKIITEFGKNNNLKRKMKDNNNKWKNLASSTLKFLAGLSIEIPETAKKIHNSNNNYYIDINGDIFSYERNRYGKKLKHCFGSSGYPMVEIHYDGKARLKEVHSLLVETFIMQDYVKKGLCCLHGDDDKLNCHIDNLSIGTYSQNNKDAYIRGCQPRRYNKKQGM